MVDRPPTPQLHRVGRRALLVEYHDSDVVQEAYAEADRRRRHQGPLSGVEEVVPGARTILFDGVDDLEALAREVVGWNLSGAAPRVGRLIEVPTVYDGPDLAAVASCWGLSSAQAVGLHTGIEHRVAWCGFAPGFAYLTGLPPERAVPRRPRPRTAVPAGSVALAGDLTGIYPRSSPGGWQLIGRTGLSLWETDRDPPALLAPGDRVRFVEPV